MKISVIVTSYNHEKYIAQCLEGILAQEGNFQLEVIIGDDFSTDDTCKIVKQFQNNNPEIILLPTGQNMGITKNLKRCLQACSGTYIAICEGDDYWTDKYKIKKQKELLDANKDYAMCFSAIMLYYEKENLFVAHHGQGLLDKKFITTEDLIEYNYIGNFSCCMYRAKVVKKIPEKIFSFYTVDWMFNMACGEMGKIGFIRDWMSVYRLHSTGAWTGKSELDKMSELCHYIDVYNEYFEYKYDTQFEKLKANTQKEIARIKDSQDARAIYSMKGFSSRLLAQVKVILKPVVKPILQKINQFIWKM